MHLLRGVWDGEMKGDALTVVYSMINYNYVHTLVCGLSL